MPKDEFDFDDPLELNGVAILTDEDTTEAMTECFIEEFMMMGYNPKQLLALFRNPHYLGMNMVLQNRGELFVRDKISEIFARWRRPISWQDSSSSRREEAQASSSPADSGCQSGKIGARMPTSARTAPRYSAQPADVGIRAPEQSGLLQQALATEVKNQSLLTSAATQGTQDTATDAVGNPVPKLNP